MEIFSAGPNFGIVISAPVNERLDKDDATYVDVYHTNSGVYKCLFKISYVIFV